MTPAPAGSLLLCDTRARAGREAGGFTRRRLFSRRNDPRDRLPHGNVCSSRRCDPSENPVSRSFHFHYGFVGFYFEERLALGDAVTFLLAPGDELAGFLRHLEGGHHNAEGHSGWGRAARPSVRDSYALGLGAAFRSSRSRRALGESLRFRARGERAIHGEVVRAGDEKFFRREPRDHFVPRRGDYDFFFDARRAPAVRRRPEGFQREHHARLDLHRMLERNQAADHRLLPDGEPDAVAVLQRERGFFVGEAEVVAFGHTAAISAVVRPGRTSSIAASR